MTTRLIPLLARILIRTLTWSVRIHSEGTEILDDLESSGKSAVLPCFHGRQFLITGFFVGRKMGVMTSLSRDGELQSRIMGGLGYGVVRGSASRSGARGLIGLKRLMEKGYHATFAIDGPKGPLYEVKPGAIYLAKKTGAPVIPMISSANPAHIFTKAWDLFLLPWPFAKGAVIFSDPIYFDSDMSEEAMNRDSRILKEELHRLQERADEITGLKIRSQKPEVRSQ